MAHIDSPCVAVDQRGSGYTPLGDPAEFCQQALVEDLHGVVCSQAGRSKVILMGHSLGGRVVLGYAAVHPERIAALIIEDMDIAERNPGTHGVVQLEPYEGVFDRKRDNKEALVQALRDVGYPDSFIERGLSTGRIEPNAQGSDLESWWSHINPDFRKLCYQHILSTSQGREDCRSIKSLDGHDFQVHVMVAGKEGTVCIEESVQEMKSILGDRLTIHRFPDADHSIHSSSPGVFRQTVRNIIARCS